MKPINRRSFLTKGVIGLTGASLLSTQLVQAFEEAKKENQFIGFQSWVVREDIEKDFIGTLKSMASLGYNQMELCSPVGYKELGFGGLLKYSAKELKQVINNAGISCISSHYGFNELKKDLQARIDFAKELGLSQMILSSFGLPAKAIITDWLKAADELNKIAEVAKKSDIQIGYHNHNEEFTKLEGQLIYEALLKQLDAELVKLQFQVWVVSIGYTAADYFKKYPGRFLSAQLYYRTGTAEEQAVLGKGKVDWKGFFAAAKTGGLKNFYVEMDKPVLGESANYLKTIL
jgi:sugar phosphate isomerase/epimerase